MIDTSNGATVLKTLPSGHVVPYPEEFFDHDGMLFLKDYRLNGFPTDDQGQYAIDMPWDEYVEWLERYLSAADFELRPEQELLRQHYCHNQPSGIMIGTHCGMFEATSAFLVPVYDFPEDFDANPLVEGLAGRHDDDPYREYLDWINGVGEDPLTHEQFVLEDYGWYLNQQRELAEFARYWPNWCKSDGLVIMGATDSPTEPADAGWRVQLSLALKTIPDQDERIRFLNQFMDEYCDYLHK
jgi:hypothetical protein